MRKNDIQKKPFLFIAMSPVGTGLSGGDRIFIELAKVLSKEKHAVQIITWKDGLSMCRRNSLDGKMANFTLLDVGSFEKMNFFVLYLARIIKTCYWSIFYRLEEEYPSPSELILFSTSEFWMDAIPGFILKTRYPTITWIAPWFQTAPNPLKGFAEGERKSRYRFSALLYWLSQYPMKPLFSHFADLVLVNNEDERKRFPQLNKKGRVFVFIGAIDLGKIKKWMKSHPKIKIKYDCVFQGRFHPQKGVLELIDIWKKVLEKKPNAKLAMIGDGPLMEEVKTQLKTFKLEKNITLLGYVFDGDVKYKTFSESRIVVHPALYDSGGMASAEAMAFGLPCVGFNLKAYESYYPKGMIKVKIGDIHGFAKVIIHLLDNKKLYQKTKKEALALVENNWSWTDRAKSLLTQIHSLKPKHGK